MDSTRENYARGLWEQQVIRWMLLTQPRERVELILLGYMQGDPRCKNTFELASKRMRAEKITTSDAQRPFPSSQGR